ncbi:MAG: leucine-rich repeat protein [Clostridia bacterium]|nr:leucine-rich repeat protein [Clostridia bacterium]
MKKKLLLMVAIVAVLTCLFAISVSAEEVLNEGNALKTSATDEFATGDQINYITGLANEIYFNGTSSQNGKTLSLEQRMVLRNDDGTYSTFPSAYLFDISKDGSKRVQRFQWLDVTLINAATGQSYEPADLIRLEIPEGITDIHHDDRTSNARLGMQNSTDLKAENLKYISFPASCTGTLTMGDFARGITALEEVDFSKMTNPYQFNMPTAFYNCTSLSKVTFPETLNSDNGNTSTCAIGENMFYGTAITSINIPSEITSIGKYAFKNTSLVSVDLSNTGVTTIQQDAFRECKNLKTVKLPLNLSDIQAEAFRDCTSLEFVDFGANTTASFQFSAHRAFYNCGELRALSLPTNTQYINNGTFALCKKLEAIYIGNSIIQINGNKGDGAGDGPTFAECEKMYFVNSSFSVTKEDGTFYTVEEFESLMPKKPDVYYFPSTLKRICGAHNVNSGFVMDENGHVKNVGAGDLAFVKCYNLNKYLVFPEGFTGVDESIQSSNNATENPDQRGDTLGTGLFHNCATESNPLTLVFMGQIHRVSFDKRNGQTSYMTYMFANSANTSFENTTIGTYIGDTYYSNQNQMYVIFCHAEGGAQKYQINFVASEADANVPVLSPTLIEANAENLGTAQNWHAYKPDSDKVVDATCTTPEGTVTYCFCGKVCTMIKKEGGQDALGHLYDNETGRYYPAVSETNDAPNYYANATCQYYCSQCNETIEEKNVAGTNLFTRLGYSVNEEDPTFVSYIVYANAKLIKETMGEGFRYGLVVSASPDGTPLAYDNGELVADDYTVNIEMSNFTYSKLTVKVINVTATTQLHCNGYVADGESIVYLNHGAVEKTAATVTHGDMVDLIEADKVNTPSEEEGDSTEEMVA